MYLFAIFLKEAKVRNERNLAVKADPKILTAVIS